jgi:hypothetical protein
MASAEPQVQRDHRFPPALLDRVDIAGAAEDLSQIRTGYSPANMAALRNLALGCHRIVGATNIAAACRHVARHPNRVLPLLT